MTDHDLLFYFIATIVSVFAVSVYMLPTMAAWANSHPRIGAIAVLNIVAGWTFIGWVAAIVWAFITPEPRR